LADKGFVTDALTDEGIKGVNLSFVLDGDEAKSKFCKTAVTIVKTTAA
jgi:hypothetical protein